MFLVDNIIKINVSTNPLKLTGIHFQHLFGQLHVLWSRHTLAADCLGHYYYVLNFTATGQELAIRGQLT